MLFIIGNCTDAYFNLASEEYLIDSFSEDIFYLWRNDNSVIVGKNQNTLSEIDLDYVEKNNIKVVRRLSGGGAVFHDLGNLNFTFIESAAGGGFSNYAHFTEKIRDYLKAIGVNAELSGRNDIVADGRKISGNAQAVRRGRVMHHGTLLFSADISHLAGALKPREIKIESKGIKSVRSRVANINDIASVKQDIIEFRDSLFEFVYDRTEGAEKYELTDKDIEAVNRLKIKYSGWEWNYGQSPEYSFVNAAKFPYGVVEVSAEIRNGMIEAISVRGDFFGERDIKELENRLVGIRHSKGDIERGLEKAELALYISGADTEDIAGLLI